MWKFLLAATVPVVSLEIARMLPLELAWMVYGAGWIFVIWIVSDLYRRFLRVW